MDDNEHEVIRLAIAADAPALRNLLYRAYEPIRMLNLKWPAAYVTQDAALANIERNECYVLEKGGSIAATITYSLEGDVRDVTDLPFIKWFAVDPMLQGHRLGARLIHYVEQTILLGKYKWPAVTLATAERHPWLIPRTETATCISCAKS
ncbi:GNAT family N-acetyltransferase [Peribacillus sp. NPDC056705]|uniref:GNAT family N-acetyltransferase n=1 Tax=Peribacillus sp. NPDC056705 TaxID=3345918 RepID=UPI0037498FDD